MFHSPASARTRLTSALALAAAAFATLLPASPAAAAPRSADLVVGLTADRSEAGPDGATVVVDVALRNIGGTKASAGALKLALPAGATFRYGELPDGWTCDVAASACSFGDVAAGTAAPTLSLAVVLPAGTHGQTATIAVTAETPSRESSKTNNTAAVSVSYIVQPDLAFEWRPESSDVSYLGGMGARAFVQAFATNIGTAAAPGVRFRFTPPAAATVDPGQDWTCDTSAPAWTCTNGRTLGAGESAYLNLTIAMPAGTVGDTVTMSGSVSTTATERSLSNNSGQTSFRYVVPRPADVMVTSVSAVPSYQVKANEEFDLHVELDNAGGSPAENVKVRVPLPPTVRVVSLHPESADWTCTTAERAVECARDSAYDVAQLYNRLRMRLVAVAGTPDGPLDFTATVATTSPEENTGNNSAQGGTVYFAEGTMSGHAWLDNDRDGQRDAGEPSAYGKVGKIEFVLEGTEPTWDVPRGYVDESGVYSTRLKPGRYVANVYLMDGIPYEFTTPDAGDDATDSDVVGSVGGYYNRGWSAVVEVTDAGDTVVDIGLAPVA
ncbi:hypothetical protein AB0F81_27045 [Actinoplanes sp. NPDC024001]|uniref:hypothetical protein n=1 Tax=Actinoplanes sp. NPDC024001 TaxID=3154598 RepID=UPI00340DA8DB